MRLLVALISVATATAASAQSAVEHYSWEAPRPLVPLSRTATAITGPVRVREQSVTFNGKMVSAEKIGRAYRVWGMKDELNTGTIIRLVNDPGVLKNGNTLCGSDKARFVVLWQSYSETTGGTVEMAVFSGDEPPIDGRSSGLCGIYSYEWK